MRKLFWQMMVSLDGFMEGSNHELDWHVTDEDFARYVADMEQAIDEMIFGRVTYQLMAAYWPTATDPEARMMNTLPKVVCSRTLTRVDWNNTRLVKDNVADEVRRLKQRPGKDMLSLAAPTSPRACYGGD
jgi:dihydrofolate reductase